MEKLSIEKLAELVANLSAADLRKLAITLKQSYNIMLNVHIDGYQERILNYDNQ